MPAAHRTEHVVLHVAVTELTPVHRTCPQVPPQLSPNTSLHTPLPQLSPHTPILAEAHSRAQTRSTLCVLSHFSHIQLFVTLWAVAHQAPLSVGFSSKNTRVGCYVLLQGIFPTQGLNLRLLHLLHWQAGSLPLVPSGKPCILAYPVSLHVLMPSTQTGARASLLMAIKPLGGYSSVHRAGTPAPPSTAI